MALRTSRHLDELSAYAFIELDEEVSRLRARGIDPIDFGVGDPAEPTPEVVRAAVKEGVDRRATEGYPSNYGSPEFRRAVADWVGRRFKVELDPDREISASIGSKEAIFNFPKAFVDPGDVVLVPNPAYPPYVRGTGFLGGEIYYLNLLPENNFLPDLDSIPPDVCRRARVLWINYPNNPTGAVASREFLEKAVAFGRRHGIIVAADEAYIESYYEEPPPSILQLGCEGVVAFHSLSKRSCMTGYRVGWVAGDARIIEAFKKLKTNIDSGTPTFIQDAAIAALSDEGHADGLRGLYRKKRDLIVSALVDVGLPECRPAATIYIWQRIPEGENSVSFAKRLLAPEMALVTMPGSQLSQTTPAGNPGDGFVRIALSPGLKQCEIAASRIREHLRIKS